MCRLTYLLMLVTFESQGIAGRFARAEMARPFRGRSYPRQRETCSPWHVTATYIADIAPVAFDEHAIGQQTWQARCQSGGLTSCNGFETGKSTASDHTATVCPIVPSFRFLAVRLLLFDRVLTVSFCRIFSEPPFRVHEAFLETFLK